MHVFLFGAGYSAKAFATRINDEAVTITGTTRHADKFAALEACAISPLLFDGKSVSPEMIDRLAQSTHIVISIAPDEQGDPALAPVEEALRRPDNKIRWIGYLSTVGVYGDHNGNWVDEDTICKPVSRRSLQRLDVEKAWEQLSDRHGTPLAILRLSGIYGPGRNAFVNLERGTARRIIKAEQVFNRIHVDDIAGALRFLAGTDAGRIFNITDDEPAPPQDVVTYAAQLMGIEPPKEVSFEHAGLTPMARSFYGENKRVSNQCIRSLGYKFMYPDYKTTLSRMWNEKIWQ